MSATFNEDALTLQVQAEEGEVLHIQCTGDISLPNFRKDNNPLEKFLGVQVFGRKILLDLEKANFLDTTGLSWLISCHEECKEAGGVVILHSIPPRVSYILKLLHMEQTLHVAADAVTAKAIALKERP